jgi:hypothetical protein
MKQKKIKLSAVLLLGLGISALRAQETIPASGGSATGSGGSAGYSVGQIVYSTQTDTTCSVAKGVHNLMKLNCCIN